MLLTIQNNFDIFKHGAKYGRYLLPKDESTAGVKSKQQYSLSTRKSFHVSKPMLRSGGVTVKPVEIKRSTSSLSEKKYPIVRVTSARPNSKVIKDLNDELKSSSIEMLNLVDDYDDNEEYAEEGKMNYFRAPTTTPTTSPRPGSRCKTSSSTHSSRVMSPVKSQLQRKVSSSGSSEKEKRIRLIQSAPLKPKSSASIERPSSVLAASLENSSGVKLLQKRPSRKSKKSKSPTSPISRREFTLEEFCDKPKYPRFIAYLSVDAQFAMMKAYEDTLRDELASIYPQADLLPRTSSARFAASAKQCTNQFNVSEDEKLKISHFIESAMKILDRVIEYKRKNLYELLVRRVSYVSEDGTEDYSDAERDEKSPLYLYMQWIKLWNKEFL